MTITTASADALEALALAIFNPANGGSGLLGQRDAADAQLYALLAEPIKAIDGRDMVPGLMLTLNQTNASQGRPKHWYRESRELGPPSLWPATCKLQLQPAPGGGVMPGPNSYGFTTALSDCACYCLTWAFIIRMWLAGNYPLAVTQPGA